MIIWCDHFHIMSFDIWYDMVWYDTVPICWAGLSLHYSLKLVWSEGVSVMLSSIRPTLCCLWTLYTPCADSPNNGLLCRVVCVLSRGATHARHAYRTRSEHWRWVADWMTAEVLKCKHSSVCAFITDSSPESPVTPLTELQQESETHSSITGQPCAERAQAELDMITSANTG